MTKVGHPWRKPLREFFSPVDSMIGWLCDPVTPDGKSNRGAAEPRTCLKMLIQNLGFVKEYHCVIIDSGEHLWPHVRLFCGTCTLPDVTSTSPLNVFISGLC